MLTMLAILAMLTMLAILAMLTMLTGTSFACETVNSQLFEKHQKCHALPFDV